MVSGPYLEITTWRNTSENIHAEWDIIFFGAENDIRNAKNLWLEG